jgi:hypothetical protein
MKVACVTNDVAEVSIKHHIYQYTTSCEIVLFDSNGMTGNHILLR